MTNPLVLTTTVQTYELLTTLSGQSVPALPQAVMGLVQAFGPTFVYRPGGVAGGNVYTTWPTLYAALSALPGPKWVEIDDSIVSPAVIPAGAYNLDQVTISGKGPASVLNLAAGVTFTATTQTLWIDSLTVTVSATAAVWTYTAAASGALYLRACSITCNNAAAPFLNVAGTSEVVVVGFIASIGDGAHEVLGSSAGGTLEVTFVGSVAAGDSLAGAGTSLFSDAASTVNLPQGAGVSLFLFSQAAATGYSPATPGNWHPVPTEAAAALDALAAPNAFVEGGGPLGPATSVTFTTTGTLSRKKSGVFVISATISGTDSTTETVVVELDIDGGGIGVPMGVPTGGTGGSWAASTTWQHTVTDTTPHTFGITATGTGNLSVAAARVGVAVFELP